jgi:hypothetical protein
MEHELRVVTSKRAGGAVSAKAAACMRRFKLRLNDYLNVRNFVPPPPYTTQFSKTLWITLLS